MADRVTGNRAPNNENPSIEGRTPLPFNYYTLLGLHPLASVIEIRRAYWQLSKRYHPDTTALPPAIATAKFQQLNEAYATLSNPEQRLTYDLKIGYSRIAAIQAPAKLAPQSRPNSADFDPTDRPLSAGELFALFILGLTFLGCLLLAIAIGLIRGDFQPNAIQYPEAVHEQVIPPLHFPTFRS